MKYLEDFSNPQKSWEVERVEWRKVKLKEIILKTEKINPKNKDPDEIFLYLDISNIDNKKFRVNGWKKLKWKDAPSRARKLIKVGDIVFATTRPYLKNIAIVPLDLDGQICSTGFCVLRPNPEFTTSEWIFYNIIRDKFVSHISSKMRGTSYPAVLDSDIYYSKIPLPFRHGKPDLETQKKIVEYIEANFSMVDAILEKKKEFLRQLDDLWESVLEHTFKPKEGEEWREVRLGEIAKEIKSGGTPSRKIKEYWEKGTIFWVKIQDIPEEGYVNETEEKITETGINNSSAKLLPKGTILFTIFATIGRVGILNIEAATNQAIAGIILKENYERKYIYWVLRKFGEELKQKGRGGTQNNVNLTFLKNLKIPLPFRNNHPDLERQKEIASYLDGIYEKIKILKEKIQNQITQLEEIKGSILDEVFNHESS